MASLSERERIDGLGGWAGPRSRARRAIESAFVPTTARRARLAGDDAYVATAWVAGTIGCLLPVAILAYLVFHGAGALTWEFVSTAPRGGALGGQGGIWPAIKGTLALVGLGLAGAFPLAIAAAAYLAEFNRSAPLEAGARFCIETLAAVPGLVYSMFGYALLVVAFKFRISLAAGAVTLGFVMLPIILMGAHEAFRAVDPARREAALALGVSRWHQFCRVVLPAAWPAVVTATMLAVAHALGAAAPLLYTAATLFTAEQLALFQPVMALPTHLYYVTSEKGATPAAFGTALVLALLVLGCALIALLAKRRHER